MQDDRSTRRQSHNGLGEVGVPASKLDGNSPRPLYLQLYDLIRCDVLEGRLSPGSRLSSSRSLASDLSVSRNTVLSAVEQLVAEGYLESRLGAGTFVSTELPEDLLGSPIESPSVPLQAKGQSARTSQRGQVLRAFSSIGTHPVLRPLQAGAPAYDELPRETWGRAVSRALRTLVDDQLDYADPRGSLRLRTAVASHLRSLRGLNCSSEQIFIVGGSQQAIGLAAHALIDPGDQVWVEEPGYIGAKAAFIGAGARLVPVPVGDHGLELEEGRQRAPHARLVYVTPSHQYPLGMTMSLRRRLELIAWARRTGGWILEDDYDSEFRFAGRPLAPLAALDPGSPVIYVGTFSKVLFPGLRLGYLVVPLELVEVFAGVRFAADRQPPSLEQLALALLMEDGSLVRHIRRMRALYHRRSTVLGQAVAESLPDVLQLTGSAAGLHVVGLLRSSRSDTEIAATAAEHGVSTVALSRYFLEAPTASGLVLGFAAFEERAIRAAVRTLDQILRPEKE